MPENRSLHLRFVLDPSNETSATEFLYLFDCVESIVRIITEHEARDLLEVMSVASAERLVMLEQFRRIAAVHHPKYGNLRIAQVQPTANSQLGEEAVEVRLQRTKIIEPRASDQQLLEEFVRRFRTR